MNDNEVKLLNTKRVDEFITHIEQFTFDLTCFLDKIQTSTRILGASFRDEHYQELNKNIQNMNLKLQNFIDTQKRLTPALREKLENIQSYQRT